MFHGIRLPLNTLQRYKKYLRYANNSVVFFVVLKFISIFAPTKVLIMSKKEKEEKAKEFWEYYEATQGTITITDPVVLD